MIRYTDGILEDITHGIGSFRPERGGALLGIPDTNIVCKFVEDPLAAVTATSYFPSEQLQATVTAEELRTGLCFRGIVHSHPGTFSRPSNQDHVAFRTGLERNPHIASFVAPIVTLSSTGDLEDHEMALSSVGKLSNYVAYRAKPDLRRLLFGSPHVEIMNEPIGVIPIDGDTRTLIEDLFQRRGERPLKADGILDINGVHHFTFTLQYQAFELIILFPPIYPLSPPSILLTDVRSEGADPMPISISWNGALASRTWINDIENAIVDRCGSALYV